MLTHTVVLASFVLIGVATNCLAEPNYQPIAPGYDFPADEATLLRFRDTDNVAEMRRHAWYVFAGLTQTSSSGAAIWETWHPQQITFTAGAEPQALGGDRPLRPFEPPVQLKSLGAQPQAAGESLLSFVMFNQEAHDFIRSNNLHLKSRLAELNSAFPANAPVDKRSIAPFPRQAVALKLVWTVIKAQAQTVMPVWDGLPTQPIEQGAPPGTWPRAVVVDTTRENIPTGETKRINWRNMPLDAHVVPVTRFYNFKIGDAEIAAVRRVVGTSADVGDYAVLKTMHITTKEIPDWVWATFWWHDQPDDGPFGGDRPTAVTGPWRNYRMDIAYSMDTPREFDGTPNVAFNPYLENFPGGPASNCMTCHRQSRWTSSGAPDFEVTRGAPAPDDPMFIQTLKADFLWAIPTQAK